VVENWKTKIQERAAPIPLEEESDIHFEKHHAEFRARLDCTDVPVKADTEIVFKATLTGAFPTLRTGTWVLFAGGDGTFSLPLSPPPSASPPLTRLDQTVTGHVHQAAPHHIRWYVAIALFV
jgi:hypothetical protein